MDLFMLFKHWSSLNTSSDRVRGRHLLEDKRFLRISSELLPTKQDFKQIAYSLVRLEEVYQLDFTKTTNRLLELDLEDVVVLGKVSFDNMNFKQFHSW